MTLPESSADDKSLHEFRVPEIYQALHNSIPPELLPWFDPIYVEYYNQYNVGRLYTHEAPIEEFRRNPAKYTISYGRTPGPDVFRITQQLCPLGGVSAGVMSHLCCNANIPLRLQILTVPDWKISPVLARDFQNLAPALVFTVELDPLRDEGEAYAAKLQTAGVPVEVNRVLGAPHLFPALDRILEKGRQYNAKVIAAMKRELGT
ncbi:hypothetical protein NUU61_007431 [Penicillium alfredii]|uniref:Alpha/beta hydrolase fold-3 domain-containing protein n=1 Tax=Penicillium alfredii TaxID=1506179 RepID=A0A9W9F326_9EURO|nr:uncharacterized protein NUU61_007431 [Penicillium alfredii]KAJ5092561.1 hypothetical protein NUU61_007431 [Penicillium alfredii]